ncbi:DUF721 domain-containing protein [Paraferrimonas haliotis]|uniref:DUF721 domain-containing protein n=1 Tax=Paraferrimonas haliotis TaxID=2013866 RepID=A0AA37WX88_9GAMM|nr:DUF721 domain-containing protein [Paraferrimonas haliotis]GLS82205.1 DUF721 domain-containing protein [Paraferrimonas haliotis]
MKPKPKGLSKVAKADNNLNQLLQHAELITALDHQVKQFVGTPTSEHLQVINLRQGVLVVAVDSASWGARFNFSKAALIDSIRACSLPMLATIEVKVNPQMAKIAKKSVTNRNQISHQAAEHINAAAESIGGELGQKLKRLASKASR